MQYHNLRNSNHNQEKWSFDGVGAFGVPALPAVDVPLDDCKFIRFDMAIREKKRSEKGTFIPSRPEPEPEEEKNEDERVE